MTPSVLAALLLLAAPSAAKEKKMETLEWKLPGAGPAEPGHGVATDAKKWAALWKELGQDAPKLDFKKYVGVVVYVGERPTGGYGVVFTSEPQGDDLLIRFRIPKPTGFVTQAFTRSAAARAFPRPRGRARVEAVSE